MTNHPNRSRGRPRGTSKRTVSISLSHDVIDAAKALGPGWMPRVDDILRRALIG